MTSTPLITYLNRLAHERRTREGLRIVLRALWLGLCVWCIALGGHLLWGWPLRYNLLAAASCALVGVSLLLLRRRRMTPLEVAQRLDRRFHLDEQLATAVEFATHPAQESLVARLQFESSRTAAQLHRRLQRQRAFPWNDVLALLAMGFVLLGLVVLVLVGRLSGDFAAASLVPPPPLVQPQPDAQVPDEPFQPPSPPEPPDVPENKQPGNGVADPQLLGPLADALREQGATRPAADALDRGDVAGAAQELRELADQASQLSDASRDDLADRLRQAAGQVEARSPQLADQLRQSASGLEAGGQAAEQALGDLAQSIEGLQQSEPPTSDPAQNPQPGADAGQQAGEQGSQAAEGGEQGQQAGQSGSGVGEGTTEQRQSAPTSRLGVEGQPLELDAQGSGQNAEQQPGQRPNTDAVVPSTTQGGGGSQQAEALGADPLRIPVDERDVVQDYFTP